VNFPPPLPPPRRRRPRASGRWCPADRRPALGEAAALARGAFSLARTNERVDIINFCRRPAARADDHRANEWTEGSAATLNERLGWHLRTFATQRERGSTGGTAAEASKSPKFAVLRLRANALKDLPLLLPLTMQPRLGRRRREAEDGEERTGGTAAGEKADLVGGWSTSSSWAASVSERERGYGWTPTFTNPLSNLNSNSTRNFPFSTENERRGRERQRQSQSVGMSSGGGAWRWRARVCASACGQARKERQKVQYNPASFSRGTRPPAHEQEEDSDALGRGKLCPLLRLPSRP